MIRRGWPRQIGLLTAVWFGMHSRVVTAGVWVTEPVLGLNADYSSNPALLSARDTAETHGAVLVDSPTTYHADAVSLTVLPSFRLSDSKGYSSIASDYAHLTVRGELDSDRNSLTATARLARDSSLYYNYALNGSAGVRNDTLTLDLAAQRALTERLSLSFVVDSTRLVYGASDGTATLTDYRYSSAVPSLTWQMSARNTVSLDASVGLYDSSSGASKSVNSELDLGFSRQFTELWSASFTAGYSRESNSISEFYGPYLLGTLHSTTTGTVFTAKVTRQGERFSVTALASRSLVPSGFSFLSLQESYQLTLHYPWTERWNVDAHVRSLKSSEPQSLGPTGEQSYLDFGLSAAWRWTEKWTVTFGASRVSAKYTPPAIQVAATGATIQLSRRFDALTWQ